MNSQSYMISVLKVTINRLYPQPVESSQDSNTVFPYDTFQHRPAICALVFHVISFFHLFRQKCVMSCLTEVTV